jgi:hypothetical protein
MAQVVVLEVNRGVCLGFPGEKDLHIAKQALNQCRIGTRVKGSKTGHYKIGHLGGSVKLDWGRHRCGLKLSV